MSAPALHGEIVRLVEADGPMPLDRYMDLCLGHAEHGYYMTRDPFGAAGDFTTAPEISQVFGEMIGVWCAQAWNAMGMPDRLVLAELGPGRGTLMADLVRAARALPSFEASIEVHLVETSPVLRVRQQEMLRHLEGRVHWHDRVDTVPEGAALFVANEFFDALPVRQFERRDGVWHERVVGLDDEGRLTLGLAPDAATGINVPHGAPEGAIFEISPARNAVGRHLGARCGEGRAAGLVIDYGHLHSGFGDTVQAVSAHDYVPVTAAPGECDLTAHVDFEALAASLREGGAIAFEPMEQGAFLKALGAEMRLDSLLRAAEPAQADDIRAAVDRLIRVDRMGALFKVCAFASPDLADLYPFHLEEP